MEKEFKDLVEQIRAHLIFCAKEVLTCDEVIQYMGVSKSYLYKLMSSRAIPYYKPMGKVCFFNRKELEAWLQKNRISTNEEIEALAQEYCLKRKM